jgi:nitrogen fixation/metabolism regulation signal transduction histidine kinase
MAYETHPRRRPRSVIRRTWLFSMLLSLPGVVFLCVFFYQQRIELVPALLLALCLLVYLALCASAFIDGLIRPLQTLSNVVASLREGDYSFRARGASSRDALGELAAEINALADLLQKQRVRSLEATALLARILEVMHAPLFAFDRENRLQLVNSSGLKLLDRSSARCLGHSAQELALDGLLAAPDQSIRSFGASPARWLLRRAAFRQEGVPHILLVLADVSVPLQEEEQAAWKRLVRVLGHELSNSLAPIKSIAGSLLARVDSLNGGEGARNDFRRGLGVVESRADALHRFVQSYRQLAQLPPPRFRPVLLGPLIERVALLEQRLSVQFAPGAAVTLDADPDQLEQMLINLLANAVDASLANSSQWVRVTWAVADASVQVAIEDHGQGIANPENLFVPFYTTKPAGSGIGLALAQQIARAHRGEISLVNREDGGACAVIRLPVALETGKMNPLKGS